VDPVERGERPLAIDLFAGAGGLALGLEQAGFDVVAAVEYDPVHAATHQFNFPLTDVLCRDIAPLEADELLASAERGRSSHGHVGAWDGEIDLLAGGPPCQGFSLIGYRLVDDPRNQLVFHFFRLVKELRPRFFVFENVPGMKVGGHSSILETLIREFEAEGYRVVKPVRALNAAEYGVPQERHRIFVFGARADVDLPRYPLETVSPVGKPLRLDPSSSDPLPIGPTVWDAIGDLPNLDDFPGLERSDEAELDPDQVGKMTERASAYARRLSGLDHDPEDLSHPRMWPRHILTSSMRTRHTELSISRFSNTAQGDVEPVSRFLRLHPEGLCNTLRAGTGSERGAYTSPRPIHPFHPRVISVREAARLHSFPDWFRLHRTKWHGFRQIGNAVAPLVGRVAGAAVREALDARPVAPTRSVSLGDPTLLGLRMMEAAEHFGANLDSIPPQRKREPAVAAGQ
jgi:DNA (cytosine-5)-methyltransferase 1